MKKKVFITAVAVCALSAACVFGATACNNGGKGNGGSAADEPSVQVTEEEWKAAFKKTKEATNYTAKCLNETYCIYEYSNSEYAEKYSNNLNDERREETYSITENIVNAKWQSKVVFSSINDDGAWGEETNEAEGIGYGEKVDEVWYVTRCFDNVWQSVSSWNTFITFCGYVYDIGLLEMHTPVPQGDLELIENLYSSFTYTDGVYRAKMYSYNGDDSHYFPEYNEYEAEYYVDFKFNSDGYVSYYRKWWDKKYEFESVTITDRMSVSVVWSDFGVTSATKNAEARQVIDKYIKEYNDLKEQHPEWFE